MVQRHSKTLPAAVPYLNRTTRPVWRRRTATLNRPLAVPLQAGVIHSARRRRPEAIWNVLTGAAVLAFLAALVWLR